MSDLPTLPNGFVLLGTAIREAGQHQHGPDWIEDGALVALDAELGAASKAWRPGADVAEGRAKHNRVRTAVLRRRAITQSMHPKLIGTPPDYRDAVPVWLRTPHRIYLLPCRIWQHQKIAKDMLGMAEGRPVAFRDHDLDYWPPGTPSTGWLMVAEKDLPRLVGIEPQLTSSGKPATTPERPTGLSDGQWQNYLDAEAVSPGILRGGNKSDAADGGVPVSIPSACQEAIKSAPEAINVTEESTPVYRTGVPGKPSGWQLIEAECRRRYSAGERYPNVRTQLESSAAWADVLLPWYEKEHKNRGAPNLTPKTTQNRLSPLLRELQRREQPDS